MSEQKDTDVEQLLMAAGQRQNPPADMRERVYSATLAAWQDLPDETARREAAGRSGAGRWLAVAASALITVAAATFWLSQSEPAAGPVGHIVYARGGLTGLLSRGKEDRE